MNKLSELLKYYKTPAFLLKNKIIIAYNTKFEELVPNIKKDNKIDILLNSKADIFTEKLKTSIFTVKKDNQNIKLTLHPFDENIADFLITAELLDAPKEIEEKEIKLQNIFRLGYVLFDLDQNYKINNIIFPEIFTKKMGIKNNLEFFNNYTSKDGRQKFQKEIILAFKNKTPYFNYNTKIEYSKTEIGRIQMRCFPVSDKGENQLFCTIIEYSSIKNLISELTVGTMDAYSSCVSPRSVDSLLSISYLWHHEDVGCNAVNGDYSLIRIDDNAGYSAALYQGSTNGKYDVWPYDGYNYSGYAGQSELSFYIK